MTPMKPSCPLCGNEMTYNSNYKYSCSTYKCPLAVVDLTAEAIEALHYKKAQAYTEGQLSMMSGE